MTITTTFVTVLRRFEYLAEKVMYSDHYKVDKKVFKTRAICRARRRSRSIRNRASVLKTSYPQILDAIFFYWYSCGR
jgi:hypothetical protein